MENIWGILLQTVTVSLTAGLLLLLKWMMADKLSPRWQYGVWSVLALRILVPVNMERDIFGRLALWTEIGKEVTERYLDSAYTNVYEAVAVRSVIPKITGMPVSVTDWLFVIYAAGIGASLMWYLVSYLRLRRLLRRGESASAKLRELICQTCEKYGLAVSRKRKKGNDTKLRIVAVPGLASAFVCGVSRPVLAVPAGIALDEKIILHELLHLKYRDSLQSIFWCVLRSLHWFNPFMQYVFDRVGNDMESLCDQRVLERLEGEERREYGVILLGMANDRYARVPGTSSISNGGKNIARRIESIVRFKKYPKGMALVSVCIIFVLIGPVMVGTAADYSDYYRPVEDDELSASMAMSRLNRCGTAAGAVDTYAKGLIGENGIYIAMASPLEKQPQLEGAMRESAEDGWVIRHLDAGAELEYTKPVPCNVFNLKQLSEEEFEAILAIYVRRLPGEDGIGYLKDENDEVITDGTVLIPIRIWKEDGWVVEETGERQMVTGDISLEFYVEPLYSIVMEGETGTVTAEAVTKYEIVSASGTSLGNASRYILDEPPVTDAMLSCSTWEEITYDISGKTRRDEPGMTAGMAVARDAADREVEFPSDWSWNMAVSEGEEKIGANSMNNVSEQISEEWDGTLCTGEGLFDLPGNTPTKQLAESYQIAVYWDGELAEVFRLEITGDE